MRRTIACAWPIAALALANCGREASGSVEPPHQIATARRAPQAEPAQPALEEPSSWPAEVEDLASAIESFESFEACVAMLRARTPTLVSEGLDDLGYGAFFEDGCRALEAARARAPERCEALSVRSARRACRRRVAIVAGDPFLCPEAAAIAGRDPLCIAWAARDPGLCRAVASDERPGCAAALAGDAARCARSPARARCEAWVRRYGRLVRTGRAPGPGTREEPSLHLEVTAVGSTGSGAGEVRVLDLPLLARGVRLVPEGCAHRVVLDDRGRAGAAPPSRASAQIEFAVPAGQLPLALRLAPAVASIALTLPGAPRAEGREGTITITELGRELGGALAGSLEATLVASVGAFRVHGSFRTFVRDLDPLPERCADGTMPSP